MLFTQTHIPLPAIFIFLFYNVESTLIVNELLLFVVVYVGSPAFSSCVICSCSSLSAGTAKYISIIVLVHTKIEKCTVAPVLNIRYIKNEANL